MVRVRGSREEMIWYGGCKEAGLNPKPPKELCTVNRSFADSEIIPSHPSRRGRGFESEFSRPHRLVSDPSRVVIGDQASTTSKGRNDPPPESSRFSISRG